MSADRGAASVSRWRALLFVPADRPDFLARAASRGADALILDLEDGVAPAAKPLARRGLGAAQAALRAQDARLVLRVNAAPEERQIDLQAADLGLLDAVLVPRCEGAADLQLPALAAAAAAQGVAVPPLIALVETPRGVMRLADIAAAPGLVGLLFGSEDYAAAMQAAPQPALLTPPAGLVAMAAAAHGLHAMGLAGSLAGHHDLTGFAALVRRSRALGLRGAAVVHPAQVSVARHGFGPDADELDQARQVIEAFEAALARDAGVVSVAGRMVDRPVYLRALQLLRKGADTPVDPDKTTR